MNTTKFSNDEDLEKVYISVRDLETVPLNFLDYLRGLKENEFDKLLVSDNILLTENEKTIILQYKEFSSKHEKVLCDWASFNGYLIFLKYGCEKGFPLKETAINNASTNGHLDCIKYLYEIGSKWSTATTCNASGGGHLKCLKFLHKNGCPWTWNTNVIAIRLGHVECLEYACKNGCPLTAQVIPNLLRTSESLKYLKIVHKHGLILTSHMALNVAVYGDLDCFKYLYENGCPLYPFTKSKAIESKSYKIVEYLESQGI
uniref:Ankyrin repeat protein n=1 Tax=viral metagenome TaxID=1070528 RepID=A0A6C0AE31_9ZZZZ